MLPSWCCTHVALALCLTCYASVSIDFGSETQTMVNSDALDVDLGVSRYLLKDPSHGVCIP